MKGLQAAATVLQLLFKDSPADLRFMRVKLLLAIRTFLSKVAWQIRRNSDKLYLVSVKQQLAQRMYVIRLFFLLVSQLCAEIKNKLLHDIETNPGPCAHVRILTD